MLHGVIFVGKPSAWTCYQNEFSGNVSHIQPCPDIPALILSKRSFNSLNSSSFPVILNDRSLEFDRSKSCLLSSAVWRTGETRSLCCVTLQLRSHMIEWDKSRRNTVIIIIIEVRGGSFSHLPDTFNSHCNLCLSCPRTSIANEFMWPLTERSGTTCLCHLADGTPGSLSGPAGPRPSPWLWMGGQVKGQVRSVWLQYTSRLCGSCWHMCGCWLGPCVTQRNTDSRSDASRGTQKGFVAMFGTHEVIVAVLWGGSVLFVSTHVHRFLLSPETQISSVKVKMLP